MYDTFGFVGCMVKEDNEEADCRAPILILDNLDNINIAELFGPLLNAVEHRGQFHSFTLNGKQDLIHHYILAEEK